MRLAVIPGDGIGPEVIDEALKVLEEVVPGTETTTYDLGEDFKVALLSAAGGSKSR